MAATKKKRGSWIVTVPLVAAAVTYFMLWHMPTRREMDKLRESIARQRDFIASSETLKATLIATQQEYDKTCDVHRSWTNASPEERELPQVHEAINRCVREAGAKITRFDPQPPVAFEMVEQLPVTLGAQGAFDHIFGMLANLEALPQTVWLEEVRITAPRKPGEFTQCLVKLAIFAKNSEKSD